MARASTPDVPESAGPRLILGTAGHIDHGKTALVRALTGVETDRLPEEKARGITIELGFAPLDLPDGTRVSVVDVPGHERLIRNMVAGATGIDLVLLVVAADEGVMPQTREHLAICELLGLSNGVVALTKLDLVDDDMAELAEEEVRELVGATSLRDAPIVRVSSSRGDGIEALRDALGRAAHDAAARTPRAGPPRLSIDRAFTVRGFGTVVTGTLVGAPLHEGAEVVLHPSGLETRVRGLQSHGAAVDRAQPGVRTAINLQGVELSDVSRGEVITERGAFAPTRVLDAHVQWLAAAPGLGDRASVELLAGTAERLARISPIGATGIAPGASGFARLHLEGEPVALLPGDRFVLRGFARNEQGGTTIGGGVVLDVAPPRRRRSDPALRQELARLAERDPATDVEVRVARAGLAGIDRDLLRRETGLSADALRDALAALADRLVALPTGRCLSIDSLGRLADRVDEALAGFHRREPLRPGMARAALRGALPDNVPSEAVERAVAERVAAGTVVVSEDQVRLASHRPSLAPAQEVLAARLREQARSAGLEPPSLREWSDQLAEGPEPLRELLAHLEREGALVRTPGDLWFDRAAVDALRTRVTEHLAAQGEIETPAYKDLIGTTRKHAVPLMELFDAERLTLRVGNKRTLRKK